MRVSEIFYSLQGEGMLAGVPSVFIRLAGCPLRCRWCDTKFAWDPASGMERTPEEIVREVQHWPCKYVVITGGEPMIQPELTDLTQRLRSLGKHITIETAGIAVLPDIVCDLMSISPKLANSSPTEYGPVRQHDRSRLDMATLRELIGRFHYQLKFVVDTESDLDEVQQIVSGLGIHDPVRIMLMPQAATREELLRKVPMVADLCKRSGYAFCQRLHILLWDNARGT